MNAHLATNDSPAEICSTDSSTQKLSSKKQRKEKPKCQKRLNKNLWCNTVLTPYDIRIEGTVYKGERCYSCLRNKLGLCRSCPSPLLTKNAHFCPVCRYERKKAASRKWERKKWNENKRILEAAGYQFKKMNPPTQDPIMKPLLKKWKSNYKRKHPEKYKASTVNYKKRRLELVKEILATKENAPSSAA